MGLTLLAQASMPLRFWWDAFLSAVYIINRLPTPVLHNISPWEQLHHRTPSYSFLRVFGSACFPCLRPYQRHKFQFHSTKCVFIGYSEVHKGYKCLSSSGRVYISRHVVFNEDNFPFKTGFPNSSSPPTTPLTVTNILTFLTASPPPLSTPTTSLPSPSSSNEFSSAPAPPADSPDLPSAAPSGDHTNMLHDSSSANLGCDDSDISPVCEASLPAAAPPLPSHPMRTRAQDGIFKPKHLSYVASLHSITPPDQKPSTVHSALQSPPWKCGMDDEMKALISNKTWVLVPAPPHVNLVGNKWVFKVKRNSGGSFQRCKARLVAKGFHQVPGVDFHETYNPVVKALLFE